MTILVKHVPATGDDFKPMIEMEFAAAYRAAHEEAGDSWSTLDVVRSWHNYQADPQGHFLSKKKEKEPA